MAEPYRVAISSDFIKPDGSPTFPDFDLEPLRSTPGCEVAFIEEANPLRGEQLEDFDALILLTQRFGRESVPQSGRLSVVARFGVGYDTVDVDACTDADIALVITPDGVRRPVAVSIITMMLALTGKIMTKDRLTRDAPHGFHRRSEHMGVGLVDRTLGSLGIGNIGAELFLLARPFDMTFIAYDPYADPAVAAEHGIELVGLEDLFRRSDILSINCPLSDETHHIVNAERIALMKPTAYLINTARGPIVDQKALTRALQNGEIAGAGLDVLEEEPPDPEDPILGLDNVILTPHALCWTDQCFAGIGAADIKAVLDVMQGHEPRGVVNRDVLNSGKWKERLAAYGSRYRT